MIDGWWSVVIHGTAQRLTNYVDIVESGVMDLVSADPAEKSAYVRYPHQHHRASGRP